MLPMLGTSWPLSPWNQPSLVLCCRRCSGSVSVCPRWLRLSLCCLQTSNRSMSTRSEGRRRVPPRRRSTVFFAIDYMGDHVMLLRTLHAYMKNGENVRWCRENFLNARVLRTAMEVWQQLLELMSQHGSTARALFESGDAWKPVTSLLPDAQQTNSAESQHSTAVDRGNKTAEGSLDVKFAVEAARKAALAAAAAAGIEVSSQEKGGKEVHKGKTGRGEDQEEQKRSRWDRDSDDRVRNDGEGGRGREREKHR
eukprot:Rmarinus@m.17514